MKTKIEKRKKRVHLVRLLLLLELALVELELLALKDVAISTADLTGAAGDAGKKLAGEELLSKGLLDGVLLLTLLEGTELLLRGLTLLTRGLLLLTLLLLLGLSLLLLFLLLLGLLGLRLLSLGCLLLLSLLAEFDAVVLQEPLTEGSRIDHDDSVAHKGVCTDELVVGSVVHHIHDTSAGSHGLSGPGEVAALKTKSAVLDDAKAAANKMDDLLANTSHGRLTANLELPLLAISNALATSRATLVDRVTSNAHLPISAEMKPTKKNKKHKKTNKKQTKKGQNKKKCIMLFFVIL